MVITIIKFYQIIKLFLKDIFKLILLNIIFQQKPLYLSKDGDFTIKSFEDSTNKSSENVFSEKSMPLIDIICIH